MNTFPGCTLDFGRLTIQHRLSCLLAQRDSWIDSTKEGRIATTKNPRNRKNPVLLLATRVATQSVIHEGSRISMCCRNLMCVLIFHVRSRAIFGTW